MSKKWMAAIAVLCACATLTLGAGAEEKRLGNLIYVPAMQAQTATLA